MTLIPTSPDEITTDWINDVLFSTDDLIGARATDFNIAVVGKGIGFMSDLCRLVPKYEVNTSQFPASFVLKFPPQYESGRETGRNLGIFEREVLFYSNCANNVPWCHPPRHYYSTNIGHDDDYLLVMEDLQGHRFVEQTGGINFEDASNIMIALARFHAHFWQNAALEAQSWLRPYSDYADIFPDEIKVGWPLLEQNFSCYMNDQFTALFPQGNALYPEIAISLQRRPTTLLHCDARMENVAFSDLSGPESVRFYDWQGCSAGTAAYDVMYFLCMSVNTSDWDSMGQDLISAYFESLMEAGVSDYSIQDLRQDMSLAACLMFGFLSMVGNVVPPDDAGHAVMKATIPRFMKVMSELGVEHTLLDFHKNQATE